MSDCTCQADRIRRYGRHSNACPEFRTPPMGMAEEFRAVFSYPESTLGKTPDTYGPWRSTLQEAAKDRVPRGEETRGWRSGFERRMVSPVLPQPVMIELDAVPIMSDTTLPDADRAWAAAMHGRWIDPQGLHAAQPGTRGRFTTQRTGQIVYRETDLAPAEVHTLTRDWNTR